MISSLLPSNDYEYLKKYVSLLILFKLGLPIRER